MSRPSCGELKNATRKCSGFDSKIKFLLACSDQSVPTGTCGNVCLSFHKLVCRGFLKKSGGFCHLRISCHRCGGMKGEGIVT